MRESTISQKGSIFIICISDNNNLKTIETYSKERALFICMCWDTGLKNIEDFEKEGL